MGLAIKSKTITKETFKDCVDVVKKVEHPFFVLYYENLYLLAYETGARISELTPIHENDIDLRYGVVHYVVRKKRKKPMETSKNITPELLERLRKHKDLYEFHINQSGGYFFFGMSSKTKHIQTRTAERHFEMARDYAGHGQIYGESKPLFKITNITNKPQKLSIYGKIKQNGEEIETVIKRITLLPKENTVMSIDPEKYKKEKASKVFEIEFAHTRKLRRCTIHSIRHLSGQTVLESKGLFEAYDHLDHVSITSTMAYLDANPTKRQSRAEVFRAMYNNEEEPQKPKVKFAMRENTVSTGNMNAKQMSQLFTQMAQMLNNMQQQPNKERLGEEFDAAMRIKAEEEHKKAFAHG